MIHTVLPQEIHLGPLLESSSMLWVYGILSALPIVVMVAIAIAVVHGHRVRKREEDES